MALEPSLETDPARMAVEARSNLWIIFWLEGGMDGSDALGGRNKLHLRGSKIHTARYVWRSEV